MRYLIVAPVFGLISASVALAADVVAPYRPEQQVAPIASGFSWTGFYLGGQVSDFLGGMTSKSSDGSIWSAADKGNSPHPAGFSGGLYAGFNVGFDNNFVLGVDSDMLWSGEEDTRTIRTRDYNGGDGDDFLKWQLKQKWSSSARVRVGFSVDRVMPYVAGGIAYVQLQDTVFSLVEGKDSPNEVSNTTKKMVGYTVGSGADFAMTRNVIVRAEYRYSGFGKKKSGEDKKERGYRTSDFRIGIAYKF